MGHIVRLQQELTNSKLNCKLKIRNNMEKLKEPLFEKQQMNATHLSNIYGGSSTMCTSNTCHNNCEDTRYVESDDCGTVTMDRTMYCP